MPTRQKRQSRLTGWIVPGLCASLLFYFGYHAQTGRYSVHTMDQMDEEALRLEFKLTDLKLHRQRLQRKVRLLTDGTIEKDALDEEARRLLGLAGSGEWIILH